MSRVAIVALAALAVIGQACQPAGANLPALQGSPYAVTCYGLFTVRVCDTDTDCAQKNPRLDDGTGWLACPGDLPYDLTVVQ